MAGEEVILNSNEIAQGMFSGAAAGLAMGIVMFTFLFFVGYYVFTALAYQSIFRKSGYKRSWMAWIPVVNIIPILELGGFHWAWVFLVFSGMIPVIGFLGTIAFSVLIIVSMWRIFKKAGYAPALSLLLLVPIANLVILGIVAWQKKGYKKVSKKKPSKKKVSKKKK